MDSKTSMELPRLMPAIFRNPPVTSGEGAPVLFETIDDALGSPLGRYFGDGHRRVEHELSDLRVGTADTGSGLMTAFARVNYPPAWSSKEAHGELRPHLSTIDAGVLAVLAAECYLACGLGLDPERRGRAWIRTGEVNAATRPCEDLGSVPVRVQVAGSGPSPQGTHAVATTFATGVGTMKVRYTMEHEPGAVRPTGLGDVYPTVWDVLDRGSYYSGAYRRTARGIDGLCVDTAAGTATALVAIQERCQVDAGLEAAYRPALTWLDVLIVAAQMAQVLLYQGDGVQRSQAGPWWMRRVAYHCQSPFQPITNPFVATVSTVKNRLIEKNGVRWRTADMETRMLGCTATFSVTRPLTV